MKFLIKAQKGSEEVILFGKEENEIEAQYRMYSAQFALGSGYRIWVEKE